MWRDIAETLTGCAYWWIIRWSLYPRSVLALHVLTIGCEILQVRAGGHQAESPVILRAESVVRSECFRGVFPEMRRIGESAVEIVNDGPIVRRVDQNNVIILRKAMSCYWKNSHSTLEMCFFFYVYMYTREASLTQTTSLSSSFPARWRHRGTLLPGLLIKATWQCCNSDACLVATSWQSFQTFSSLYRKK